MNRYKSGGPSKATATTLCQKCLKKGHYSYECNAAQQERPYTSRPSRTQQLLNPRLAPKITTSEESPPKKRSTNEPVDHGEGHRQPLGRRSRSASSYSSGSVSTISTNRSRSRSGDDPLTDPRHHGPQKSTQRPPISKHRSSRGSRHPESPTRSRSPGRRGPRRSRARSRSGSPVGHSRKGYRARSRDQSDSYGRSDQSPLRKPSLSPYSARQALTRAMNDRT